MAETPRPTWRVVLPRLPGGPPAGAPVPRVLLSTPDESTARELARRMREQGAPVLLVEAPAGEDVLCEAHPAEAAGGICDGCGTAVCLACLAEAGGRSLCPGCARARASSARFRRLRTLTSVLVFVVFLQQVFAYLQREAAAIDPERPVRVGVFQFVEPGAAQTAVVRALNDPDSPAALSRLGDWFDAERHRYTGRGGPWMDVHVRGPWVVDVSPPELAGPDDPWWTIAWKSWRYPGYFHGLGLDYGVDVDDYGARVYVVYATGHDDLASHSRGSKKGRIAVSWVSTSEANPAYAQVTVAHELAHVLGAQDSFQEGSYLARWPEGFVEPAIEGRYPQRYAELMAVDIPLGPDTEGEVRSLDQVRVGYRSAADIGWISAEQADLFYLPRPPAPEAAATPRSRAWPPVDETAGASVAEAVPAAVGEAVPAAVDEAVPAYGQ